MHGLHWCVTLNGKPQVLDGGVARRAGSSFNHGGNVGIGVPNPIGNLHRRQCLLSAELNHVRIAKIVIT